MNAKRVEEAAAEYKVAYQQLKHVDKKIDETLVLLDGDRRLAERRYQLARKAFVELALEEDDAYLAEEDQSA